jgi:hypothetical protein
MIEDVKILEDGHSCHLTSGRLIGVKAERTYLILYAMSSSLELIRGPSAVEEASCVLGLEGNGP